MVNTCKYREIKTGISLLITICQTPIKQDECLYSSVIFMFEQFLQILSGTMCKPAGNH